MTRSEVAALVRRVAREVVEDYGIKDVKGVGDRAFFVAYDRLWQVDKIAVELHSDWHKVLVALQEAAARR